MHEQSIARRIWRQANEIGRQHAAGPVRAVRVELGPLAGVEPCLLATAFQHVVAAERSDPAPLTIDRAPLVMRCASCGRESRIDTLEFSCPHCASQAVTLISGDQLQLVSVTFDEDS